jgi:hypothetical protein
VSGGFGDRRSSCVPRGGSVHRCGGQVAAMALEDVVDARDDLFCVDVRCACLCQVGGLSRAGGTMTVQGS